MAQVNGSLRPLTTRLSSDRVPSVKYSTLCPSRSDSPAAAMRAMPINFGEDSISGSSGSEVIGRTHVRHLFAYNNSVLEPCQMEKVVRRNAARRCDGHAADRDGKPAEAAFMKSCFPCHEKTKATDYVFTRYTP